MKVKIIKQVGQTGLLKPDTIVERPKSIAQRWVEFGWAKEIKPVVKRKPRKKKTDVQGTE